MGIWTSIALLLLATSGAFGKHFRGGSMSWKPIGNNQIELRYQVSFTAVIGSNEGDPCTVEGETLTTRDDITCASCVDGETERAMMWTCTDLDVSGNSAYGDYTMTYQIPSNQFDIEYASCCWIPLISPDTSGASGWKMLAHVDLTPRITDGRINRSPVSAPIPTEKFYRGCQYLLRIPASDPDNDIVKCRFADKSQGECSSAWGGACGEPHTDGVIIQKRGCLLNVDTSQMAPGKHAVNVILEDFLRLTETHGKKKNKTPLSKVSLLFLLDVADDSDTCAKPTIVDPLNCITVRPGQQFQMDVVAEPGDPSKPYVQNVTKDIIMLCEIVTRIDTIRTQKPIGMIESDMTDDLSGPGRKKKTLTWTPTVDQIGEHPVCYSALDDGGYTSGTSCTFIYVDDDPLHPLKDSSTPSEGSQIDLNTLWRIEFSDEIDQPTPKDKLAYIRLVDRNTGTVAYEAASHSASEVTFSDTHINFHPDLTNLQGPHLVHLRVELDEGVALPASGGCGSEAASWDIDFLDLKAAYRTTAVPPPVTPPVYKCDEDTMELNVPPSVDEGEQCFIHLPESVTVTGGVLPTNYKLCCPKDCNKQDLPGGPPGTIGRPGTNQN